MSQFGGIQQIGQVAFNPAAAPVETYVVPIAGQPLAGNNLQQIAEALAPMSPALGRFAMAITEEGRQQAAMEGAGVDFSKMQLSKDIEANEKAFRDVIAQTGSPNAANPYFLIAAREAYGKSMARNYEGEVVGMLSQLQDPFNSPDYAAATAELRKKYQDQLGSNLYSSSSFNLAAQEIDGRMARRVFEAKSQNMEKFRIRETGVEIGNDLLALGQFGKNTESIDRIGQRLDDLYRVGVDGTESLIRAANSVFSNPDMTPDQIDEIMSEISDVRVGKAVVAQNAALMGQLSGLAERAKNTLVSRSEREQKVRDTQINDYIADNLVSKGFMAQLRKSADPTSLVDSTTETFRQSLGSSPSDALVEQMRETLAVMVDNELKRRASITSATISEERGQSEVIFRKMMKGEIPLDLKDPRLTPEDTLTLALRKSNSEFVDGLRKASFAKPINAFAFRFDGVIERETIVRQYEEFVEAQINSVLPEIGSMDPATAVSKLSSYAESFYQEFSKSFAEQNQQKMDMAQEGKKAAEDLSAYLTAVQRGDQSWDQAKASRLLASVLPSDSRRNALSGEVSLSREYEAVTRVASMNQEIGVLAQSVYGVVSDASQVLGLTAEWKAYFPLEQQRELVEESRGRSPAEREAFIVNNIRDRFESFARMKLGQQQSQAVRDEAADYIASIQSILSAPSTAAQYEAVQKVRVALSTKIKADMKALGVPSQYVGRPSLLAKEVLGGNGLKVDGGVFTPDTVLKPAVVEKIYRSYMDANGYRVADVRGLATGGAQDQLGVPFKSPPNPWKTSFAVDEADIAELEKLGFLTARKAFPGAINTEEDFKTWIEAQRTLMLLRGLSLE